MAETAGKATTEGVLTLGIDTSSSMSSLALTRQGVVIASLALMEVQQHSQVVFEHLEALTTLTRTRVDEIDLFAAVTGPGSFTGLRIGLAAIEGIAAALGKPAVGVTTFDASARAVRVSGPVVILVDAGRGDVFMGIREVENQSVVRTIGRDFVGSLGEAFVTAFRAIPQNSGACLTGSACRRYYRDVVAAARSFGVDLNGSGVVPRDLSTWHLIEDAPALAPATAAQATSAFLSGRYPGLTPYYLKPSDAEAKWKNPITET